MINSRVSKVTREAISFFFKVYDVKLFFFFYSRFCFYFFIKCIQNWSFNFLSYITNIIRQSCFNIITQSCTLVAQSVNSVINFSIKPSFRKIITFQIELRFFNFQTIQYTWGFACFFQPTIKT